MYRVQSDYIRHLSKKEYVMLAEMCRYSNNLYNVAVYNIRQQFFRGEGYLPYEKNYKLCKEIGRASCRERVLRLV